VKPKLILINPWIYDFAAYDLWSKPLGLLYLGGLLRASGFDVQLVDCMDIHHPGMKASSSLPHPLRKPFGIGKFRREIVKKPLPLKGIRRFYSRYGIPTQDFVNDLARVKNPSAILVTSLMTYWYPGVKEVISICREFHPGTPILLGGIYTKLCENHASTSGADQVVAGISLQGMATILEVLKGYGVEPEGEGSPLKTMPFPSFDLLHGTESIALLTSTGCPYRCEYCASSLLSPGFSTREPDEIVEEILYWRKTRGVQDFAFYDDALLMNFETHAGVFLEKLARLDLDLRFHTPNALHVREITSDVAELLRRAGFRTIRLGLETSDMVLHKSLDRKVSEGDFERAVGFLLRKGFPARDIGAYILAGLPDQSIESVLESIDFAAAAGANPYVAEYSPIPNTPLWERAVARSAYDLASEPLFHNNTLLPCWDDGQRLRFAEVKRRLQELRKTITVQNG
jgi:radical SAM superfamily enzyme YgiQ (UPF0313 family)